MPISRNGVPISGNELAPATREERVVFCMEMMRAMRWTRGKTDKLLARRWDVDVDTIWLYSAEAWRRIRAEVTDPDATAGTICIALERVIDEAARRGLAGHRSIIEAGKAWASIAGAGAPTRFEIGALAQMSDEELERRKREIIARLAGDDPTPPPKPKKDSGPQSLPPNFDDGKE